MKQEDFYQTPISRFFTSAVIYNDYLYIFGGTHTHTEELKDFWRVSFHFENYKKYCLIQNKWECMTDLLTDEGDNKLVRNSFGHAEAVLYKNEMIIFGGFSSGTNSNIIRINLDNFKIKSEKTDYKGSFWHSLEIWKDYLIIFGGIFHDFKQFIYFRNLQDNSLKKLQMPGEFQSCDNLSHFIHEDNLYFTSRIGSIFKLDLNTQKFQLY